MQDSNDAYVEDTRQWMRYAQGDLTAAEASVAQEDFEPRHACFFAQQAAEKVIKAILVYSRTNVPRTHDLDTLIKNLPPGWDIAQEFPDLNNLTEWAVGARYPELDSEPTVDTADEAVHQAREICAAVQRDLIAHGFDPENGSSRAAL